MNRKWLAAGVVCIALTGFGVGSVKSASAADMPTKAPLPSRAIFAPATGFYAVLGGSSIFSGGSTGLSERNCSPTSFVPCTVPASMTGDGGWGIFGGVGYRFNRWFRGEVRVGYGETSATGSLAPPGFSTSVNADFNSTVVMFNGYFDIAGLTAPGTFGMFEPYVGVGIGFADNHGKNVRFVVTPGTNVPFTVPDGSYTDFAWNVSVGTAIRLSALGLPRNWLFDVAYRYRDLGKVKTAAGNVIDSTGAVVGTTNGFEVAAQGHGIDFALRYEFY